MSLSIVFRQALRLIYSFQIIGYTDFRFFFKNVYFNNFIESYQKR